MSVVVWTNNASATLAAAITSTQTTITVNSGEGALFPAPTSGQFFPITLISASNASTREIVYCTSRSSDTLTVQRGQESTAALTFNQNDLVNLQPTAGTLAEYGQLGAVNTWTQAQTLGQGAVLPNNVTIRGDDTDGTAHPLIGMGTNNQVTIDGTGIGAATGSALSLGAPGTTGSEAVSIAQLGTNGGNTATGAGGTITANAVFTAPSKGLIIINGNASSIGGAITQVSLNYTNATDLGHGGSNWTNGAQTNIGTFTSSATVASGANVTMSATATITGGTTSNINFVYFFIPTA